MCHSFYLEACCLIEVGFPEASRAKGQRVNNLSSASRRVSGAMTGLCLCGLKAATDKAITLQVTGLAVFPHNQCQQLVGGC